MAKKIKFPLEMREKVQVRTLDELREYFDIEKALGYLIDGKLQTWLEDRYYSREADEISKLDAYASDVKEKLGAILGVEIEVSAGAEVDIEEIERRKERLAKLKQYTDNEDIWTKIDSVAFNQEELADLLDEDCKEIYLCGDKFHIPTMVHNVKYVGVNNPYVEFSGEDSTEYRKKNNIQLLNLKYDVKNVDEGLNLYLEYKLNEALAKLTPEAENGDGCAMFILSYIYCDGGLGIEQDYEKQNNWYKKGWEIENELCSLVYALFAGLDMDEKKRLCQKYKPIVTNMANEGNVLATNLIGITYLNETDEEIDYRKAVYWFEKASSMGYWRADNSLGLRYLNGQGVEQNNAKAVEYFRKAAEAGFVSGQYNLGRCYYFGWGVDKNSVKAKEWLEKAAEQRGERQKSTWRNNLLNRVRNIRGERANSVLYFDLKQSEEITSSDRKFSSQRGAEDYLFEQIRRFINKLNNSAWDMYSANINNVINSYVKSVNQVINSINDELLWLGIIEKVEFEQNVEQVIRSVISDILYDSYFGDYDIQECVNASTIMENGEYSPLYRKWYVFNANVHSISKEFDNQCKEFDRRLKADIEDCIIKPIENQLRGLVC